MAIRAVYRLDGLSDLVPTRSKVQAWRHFNYSLPGNDPAGYKVSQATLLFEHAGSGNGEIVTIDLTGTIFDGVFTDGL